MLGFASFNLDSLETLGIIMVIVSIIFMLALIGYFVYLIKIKKSKSKKSISNKGEKNMKNAVEKAILKNEYIARLKKMENVKKSYYEEIKNKLLSFIEIDNYLLEDSETFRIKNRVIGLLTIKNDKLVFYLKMQKTQIDQRFNNAETKEKKYQNAPMQFVLEEDVDVRKAISSIEKFAKENELLEKKEYHPIGFGWLIRF